MRPPKFRVRCKRCTNANTSFDSRKTRWHRNLPWSTFCVHEVTVPTKSTHYSPQRKRSASTDPCSTKVLVILKSLGMHQLALSTVWCTSCLVAIIVFGTVFSWHSRICDLQWSIIEFSAEVEDCPNVSRTVSCILRALFSFCGEQTTRASMKSEETDVLAEGTNNFKETELCTWKGPLPFQQSYHQTCLGSLRLGPVWIMKANYIPSIHTETFRMVPMARSRSHKET